MSDTLPQPLQIQKEQKAREDIQEFREAFKYPLRTLLGLGLPREYKASRKLPDSVLNADAEVMADNYNAGFTFDAATQTWRNPNAPEGLQVLGARESVKRKAFAMRDQGKLPQDLTSILYVKPEGERANQDQILTYLKYKQAGPVERLYLGSRLKTMLGTEEIPE